MKLAIISDTHDNWPNIQKAVTYSNKQKIKTIIHCGDVCSPQTLEETVKLFNGKIHLAHGNVDGDREGFKMVEKKFPEKLKYYGNTGLLKISGLTFTFCHFPLVAKKMAESQKYDFVFHGHTHTPWQKKTGKTEILNPGTLAGMFTKATFAVLDLQTKKAELILLEKM